MAQSQSPQDSLSFIVAIDAVPVASFAECALPAVSIDVLEYREGFDPANNAHKLPGLVSYGNLILKRGMVNAASSLSLWDWFSSFISGTGKPKSLTVTLLDRSKNPTIQWSFTNAWPVKYESPVLNGRVSALAIEGIEVAVESMKVSNVSQNG